MTEDKHRKTISVLMRVATSFLAWGLVALAVYYSVSAFPLKDSANDSSGVPNNIDPADSNGSKQWATIRTPEMYGAVGDGITDDTDAFVALFENGGTVRLRAGATYLLNSKGQNKSIVLKENTEIDFNGSTIVSKYKHAFRNFDTKTDSDVKGYEGNGNLSVRNGTVVYGSFTLSHANGIKISNMCFKDCVSDHVFQLGGCENVIFDHCVFKGMKDIKSGTLECINIECMDWSGQPYFKRGSVTYDLTPTKNIVVKSCVFEPDYEHDEFSFMGDAVGTHYAPAKETDTYSNIACKFFSNIEILCCRIITNKGSYGIRCNNWSNVTIDTNYIDSVIAILMGNNNMSNDKIRITNNTYTNSFNSAIPILASLRSGNNTDLVFLNNKIVDDNREVLQWNAMRGWEQGRVSFKECDGIQLINAEGNTIQADREFRLHPSLSFGDFTELKLSCGTTGEPFSIALKVPLVQIRDNPVQIDAPYTADDGSKNIASFTFSNNAITSDTLSILSIEGSCVRLGNTGVSPGMAPS